MLKDLLKKFDKEFDEEYKRLTGSIGDYGWCQECGIGQKGIDIKPFLHSYIEAAYQSNLEKLIEKCGDYFGAAIKTENGWKVGNVDFEETLPGSMPIGTGKTFTEAVENLIKALGK